MELTAPLVCFDRARHSCIIVKVTPKKLFIIPMSSDGITLEEVTPAKFTEQGWEPSDYSVGRAAAHYLASGEIIPITKSARNQLEPLASPLDIAPAAIRAAAIAFVNTNNKRRRQRVADPVEDSTPAAKEIEDMATPKKTAVKPKKEAVKPEAPTKTGRKPGVTSFIKECLLKGMEGDEIIMEIRDKFPESKAGKPEIAWCKGQLKKEGSL